jgi:hypothetical protein
MKPGKWAKLLFVAAPLLIGFGAGCGDFWQAPTTTTGTGTCTTNCSTGSSGNFYILDGGASPGIVGNSIVNGSLTAISGSPWLLTGEGSPSSMAIDPAGNFLVVSTTSGVFSFPISNGTLGAAVTVSTDQVAEAVQVDATSSWVIETIPGQGEVTIGAVPIDSTTGAGTGSEVDETYIVANAVPQRTVVMTMSGDNKNIFVALDSGGTVVVPFASAPASGQKPLGSTASTIAVATAGGSALSVAVDPGTSPRLFYIGETLANSTGNSGGLRIFNYSSLGSSKLTEATGSPIASGGLAPNFILPSSDGNYVYAANGQGTSAGNIAGFTITASSAAVPVYTVATDTTTAAGEQPLGMAEDSSGTFVFEVGSAGSPYFDSYTFDATVLGQLDSQIASPSQGNAVAIVAAPQ